MTTPVAFADITGITCAALASQLPAYGWSVPVVSVVPHTRPAKFVQVIRTGGVGHLTTEKAQVSLDCWGDSPQSANALAAAVRALVYGFRGQVLSGTPIYMVNEFAGPSYNPDPLSGQARVSMTMQIHTRGFVLT